MFFKVINGVEGGARARIQHCDIIPRNINAWNCAIGDRYYHSYRNYIDRVTDAYSGVSRSGNYTCSIRIQGDVVATLVQWRPDAADVNRRSHTRNDVFQGQGNKVRLSLSECQ